MKNFIIKNSAPTLPLPHGGGKNCLMSIANLAIREGAKGFTLAEGATHVGTWKSSRQIAFTLAEVLITLGVIGVVAAMTLPTLIKNYQKHVWVNQLKKSVSVVENGFKLAMADDEVMELENTKLMQSLGNDTIMRDENKFKNFMTEFNKYFKVISAEITYVPTIDYKFLSGGSFGDAEGDYSKITLADGCILFINNGFKGQPGKKSGAVCEQIKQLGGSTCALYDGGEIDIDVNGNKGPNQLGRDRFRFSLGNNGLLYPDSGKDGALYVSQEDLSTNINYWKNDNFYCNSKDSNSMGFGCAARIMENGWKMDY